MPSISIKIALPIFIAGLFAIVVFIAGTYQILDYNAYIILIPLTVFLLLFGFATGQKFSTSVKRLITNVDYISSNNPKLRLKTKDSDELGQLAKVFNNVAEKFEKNSSDIEALDKKVKLRTETLEGIIKILEQKIKNRTLEFQRTADELESTKNQLKIKDVEIMELKNMITTMSAKKTRKKVKA